MTHELNSGQRTRWWIQNPRRTSAEPQIQPPVYEKPLTIREWLNQEPDGKVAQSYKLAEKIHEGQVRFSGEPYISHPEAVTDIINTEFYNGALPDVDLICAALLHDTLEDTNDEQKLLIYEKIKNDFGEGVAYLVESVSQFRSDGSEQSDTEYLQKQAAHGIPDPRVFVLKLADRLHNMRTLQFVPEEKQIPKAKETHIYAGLAERLGMWAVKTELEDLAFKYESPDLYQSIKEEVDSDPRLTADFISKVENSLNQVLRNNEGTKGSISVRKNGLWALYDKRIRLAQAGKGRLGTFSHINDLVSFRIVCDTVNSNNLLELYSILGAIHNHPKFNEPLDETRLDEFLAKPKGNKYSALQTTIDYPEGSFEIAITTKEREEFNNWGIMYLLRRGQLQEATPLYELKIVFDEEGKAIFLNKDATGVDFVYAKNPWLGAQAISLIVNEVPTKIGQFVPNASSIKVVASEDIRRAPPAHFLEHCSPETQKIIESQYALLGRDFDVVRGSELLEPILSRIGLLVVSDWPPLERILLTKFDAQDLHDLYLKIARTGEHLLNEISQVFQEEGINKEALSLTTIRLRGKNSPHVLRDVSNLIDDLKVDTRHILTSKPIASEEGDYELRIVINNPSQEILNTLNKKLGNDQRFDQVTIV